MTTRRGEGLMSPVNYYGAFTAKLLQHQAWQQEAMRQAEVRRALHTGRRRSSVAPLAARRVTVAIGGALICFGMRLQGQARPAVPNPAR